MQPTVAVIGAGFSGTLLSLRLQASSPPGTRIHLIERSGRFGVGQAYDTDNPNHLLNVPAGRMGACPDVPLDFVNWLRLQRPAWLSVALPTEGAFVPRRLYRAYLQHLLTRAMQNTGANRLELIHDHVVGMGECDGRITLATASGGSLVADRAVLAMGHIARPPFHPDISALNVAGLWRGSPWEPAAFATLDPQATVMLVGTGLTMVDAVISLLDSGHTGRIYALSRHGMLPRRHAGILAAPAVVSMPLPQDLASLMRWVRRAVAQAGEVGIGWQSVIDSLRPVTRDLWRGMSLSERKRFLRHARSWWDVHRHRMPAQIADRIEAAEDSGQLRVCAGRVVACDAGDGQARVTFRRREGGGVQTLWAARVIDCTGACSDITQNTDRLLQALLRSGVARPDPLQLGLDVAPQGAVLNRAGIATNRLFAVGALTKGANWEITAVPDLRAQCHALAELLGQLLADGALAQGSPGPSSALPRGDGALRGSRLEAADIAY